MKALSLADNKNNCDRKVKFVLGRKENVVGKGENAGYQHFLLFLFLPCFEKLSFFLRSLEVGTVW